MTSPLVNRFAHHDIRRMQRPEITIESVVSLFESGVSVKAIAESLGIARSGVQSRLKMAGIKTRSRSESMVLRMAQTSAEERQRLSSAAHAAVRGKRRTADELRLRARNAERTLRQAGRGEAEFASMLRDLGIETTPQLAIDRYNVDLAHGAVAVEIEIGTSKDGRAATRCKAKDLLERGWCVVIVAARTPERLTVAAAKDVAAFIERADRDPSFRGEYRVIRGSGDLVTASRGDLDQIT
jgi:hypothetical protein